MEQTNQNSNLELNPENKKKNILLWFLITFAALAVVFFSAAYVKKFAGNNEIKKQNPPAEAELSRPESESQSIVPPKNIYYLTATVTEKRENELVVSGMIPETSISSREEPRLVTTDEKTQIVKILIDDYQIVSFNDIKKGDKIIVSTAEDFKNNQSVLALTISVYPASNE